MTRRLGPDEAADVMANAQPLVEVPRPRTVARTALVGTDASGAAVEVELEGWVLVLFVSTTCDACLELAALVRDGVAGLSVIGALRVPAAGLPDAAITSFVGGAGRWVLGDDAFFAFDVRSAPFFCVLDGARQVVVEGLAFGREDVVDHCTRALAGTASPDAVRLTTDPHG